MAAVREGAESILFVHEIKENFVLFSEILCKVRNEKLCFYKTDCAKVATLNNHELMAVLSNFH